MSNGGGMRPGLLVPPKPNDTHLPPTIYDGGVVPTPPSPPSFPKVPNTDCGQKCDLPIIIVVSIYIVFGLLYTYIGYRCFKTVMFLTGFIFASSIVYLICLQGVLMPLYGNVAVALLAGILFGLITMLVQYVGLFMNGLHTGLLVALIALVLADHLIESSTTPDGSVWLCVGVLLIGALLFAILNLYFRKGLTIIGTVTYGGAILSVAIDYFVEHLAMVGWLWDRATLAPIVPPPYWYSWLILAAWPSFIVTGLVVQCMWTGRGIHHDDMAAGRKKPRGVSVRSSGSTSTHHHHHHQGRVDRAEMRQKKYRYLYQVRTAHGDVISQNFVAALQKKECGSSSTATPNDGGGGSVGECSTLQSDATHLTILPDAQLAALTESEDDSQTEMATAKR